MLLSSAESPLMASCQHRLVPTRRPTFKHVLCARVIGQFVSSAPSERRFSFVCGCEIELPQQERVRCRCLGISRCIDGVWLLAQRWKSPDVAVMETTTTLPNTWRPLSGALSIRVPGSM